MLANSSSNINGQGKLATFLVGGQLSLKYNILTDANFPVLRSVVQGVVYSTVSFKSLVKLKETVDCITPSIVPCSTGNPVPGSYLHSVVAVTGQFIWGAILFVGGRGGCLPPLPPNGAEMPTAPWQQVGDQICGPLSQMLCKSIFVSGDKVFTKKQS